MPGCSRGEAEVTENDAEDLSACEVQPLDSAAADYTVSETPETQTSSEQKLQHYLAAYSPKTVYQDYYIDGQYLFILERQIMKLFLAGEFATDTVIDASDIVGVETSTIGDVALLKITDKANGTMEFAFSPDNIEQIQKEISSLPD